MADQFTYPHLPQSPCLTEEQLMAYLGGKLTPAQQHEAELHITDCAMCSDAVDGWRLVNDRSKVNLFPAEVTMQAAAPAATAQNEEDEKPKVIPLYPRRKLWLSIAASVAVIAVIATTIKFILPSGNKELAENTEAKKQTILPAPAEQKNEIVNDSVNDQTAQQLPKTEIVIGKPDYDMQDNVSYAESVSASEAPGDILQPVAAPQPTEDARTESLNNDASKSIQSGATAYQWQTNTDAVAAEKESEAYRDKVVSADTTLVVGGSFTLSQNTNATAPQSTYASPTVVAAPSGTYTIAKDEDLKEIAVVEPRKREKAKAAAGATIPQKAEETTAKPQHPDYKRGLELMTQKNYTAAITAFDKVLAAKTNANYADAQWQKALALIQLKRTEEAKKLLREIIAANGSYKAKAEAELKKL
jgi:tetratricopeptide (TPR) repeat protein